MAKYICPSCGAPYNGKKCRNCAYESFSEEIAHNLHVHEGEPLVIHDTTRRPVPYKDPFDCPPSHPKKKKKSRSGSLSKVLLIVFIAIFLCNVLPILFASVIDHAESDIHSETLEAVTLPLDGKTLLDDESFSIVAQWQDGKDDRTDIPIYIVNHTDREYEFSSQDVTVNGYCLDDFCSFYADVPSGETVKGTLYLSDTGLATANIAQIQQIEFSMTATAYDRKNHTSESHSLPAFVLRGNAAEDYVQTDRPGSTMLYADDDLILSYVCLWAEDYDEDLEDMELILCAENSSEEDLSLYDDQIFVNGEVSGVSLWARVPAQSKTLFRVYLYGIGVSRPEEVDSFIMDLRAYGDSLDTQLTGLCVPIN